MSDHALLVEAITRALEDAGLELDDIDGLVTYQLDSNDPLLVANRLGLGALRWFSVTHYGGGLSCGTIQDAKLAVEAGLADVVVVYRAGNLRSGMRYGQLNDQMLASPFMEWALPFGIAVPAHTASLWAHRYMHRYGIRNEDLATIAIAARDFAATNPDAHFFGRPLTLEEHQASPWVIEPVLRVPDCCLETDGGVAVVVTTLERARRSRFAPVRVTAAARGMGSRCSIHQNFYREDTTTLPDAAVVAAQLWEQSGLGPRDIRVAMLYDAFSPFLAMSLEEFGWCPRGRGVAFVAEGNTGRQGSVAVNPSGGQLAEAYIHGFNGIVEAVRQLRGTAANPVAGVEHVLLTGGPFHATSGMILSQ